MFISTASGNQVGLFGIGYGLKSQLTPTYIYIYIGVIVYNIDAEGCEFIARVPDTWEYEPMDDEVIIADDDEMQGRED